ncbi:hypothetical protein [Erythrobacter sp. R86502]|uniref:hypothetical protein n=1 Tax=Erythrobacter sp. R86502 TaxID=3093846 RepID=UPI0036D3DA2A
MKVFVALLAVVHNLALSGCSDAAQPVQAGSGAVRQDPPAMAQGSRQHTGPAADESTAKGAPAEARTLLDEVKRLNAACVAVGGGVSGSPDCDQALVREEELEALGYCIDYLNEETLARCAASSGADSQETSWP